MIAQFFDRQDSGNPYIGANLSDPDTLRGALESVRLRSSTDSESERRL